ncbi:MAG: hypothetical protein H6741_25000 [Alphaproteobacteria bacterium]|nr:hypothetical protein [Alphaproteobacteria bacterium]MCB9795967.1 hypothetical protein [Alphaproteobacteria bacterium]
MNRWVGLLNIAQGAVFIGFGQYIASRWAPGGALFYAVAAAQIVSGGLLLAQKGERATRWAAMASLAAAAFILGLHLQVGVHIVRSFTPVGGKQGYELMAAALAAMPWLVFFPLWQLLATRPSKASGGGAVAAVLLGLLVPPMMTWSASAPDRQFAEVDGAEVARWAYARWQGQAGAPPSGPGPVALAFTVVAKGEVLETASVQGPDLAAALAELKLTVPARPDGAVLVDVALWEAPLARPIFLDKGVAIARPGDDIFRGPKGLVGTMAVWRGNAIATRQVVDGLFLPTVKLSKVDDSTGPIQRRVRSEGWMASARGAVPLKATWSAPPELTPEAVLAAAHAGALHIAANMQDDDEYAYIVQGPSGSYGRGYNFPRHAGGSWYLARAAKRTGDPAVREALLRGLDYMKKHTHYTEDGRAFILDPTRRDGKVWVGTTGLGLLAFIEAGVDPELQAAYAAFIASSVDARGSVRGDMDQETGEWPEQDEVTYAQGQGLLALASSQRAGLPGVSEALTRAAAYVDGDYWPLPAANFKTLDEHWMCLAAAAVGDATGTPSGADVCRAYLAEVAINQPVAGQPYRPPAGPAAGLAEAVVALAEIERRQGVKGDIHARALEYGRLLMDNLYQPSDAPLVGRPDRLIGGFRDRPWSLDVRVDAVQHIGCALMGVEQLLRDERIPGAMP